MAYTLLGGLNEKWSWQLSHAIALHSAAYLFILAAPTTSTFTYLLTQSQRERYGRVMHLYAYKDLSERACAAKHVCLQYVAHQRKKAAAAARTKSLGSRMTLFRRICITSREVAVGAFCLCRRKRCNRKRLAYSPCWSASGRPTTDKRFSLASDHVNGIVFVIRSHSPDVTNRGWGQVDLETRYLLLTCTGWPKKVSHYQMIKKLY